MRSTSTGRTGTWRSDRRRASARHVHARSLVQARRRRRRDEHGQRRRDRRAARHEGHGESDGSNVDMNYFLGIRRADNVLVADFERYGRTPGSTIRSRARPPSRTAVVPRRRDLRRHEVAAVPRRRARTRARRRRLHAAGRQHPARRHRHRARTRRRVAERQTQGSSTAPSTKSGSGASRAPRSRSPDGMSGEIPCGARTCSGAGASTRAPAARTAVATAAATGSTARSPSGAFIWVPGAPFNDRRTTRPACRFSIGAGRRRDRRRVTGDAGRVGLRQRRRPADRDLLRAPEGRRRRRTSRSWRSPTRSTTSTTRRARRRSRPRRTGSSTTGRR